MQRQVAEGRHLRVGSGVLTATAQQGPDTGKQLLRLKGFGQVVVRTGVQAADAVIQLTAGGEHQHRQAAAAAAQLAQQGKAIHAGKHGVQHQQVVDIAAGVVQAGDAVITHVGGIALAAQQVLQGARQALFILHDQYTHSRASLFMAYSPVSDRVRIWVRDDSSIR